MEALEAIYGIEYFKIPNAPPRFSVHLREPGSYDSGSAVSSDSKPGPPSCLFSIKFAMPQVRGRCNGFELFVICLVVGSRCTVTAIFLHSWKRQCTVQSVLDPHDGTPNTSPSAE